MSFLEHLKPAVKEGKGWLLFNASGIGIYLAIESWISVRCQEEALNGFDQTFLWVSTEFPLLAFYFGVNVTWLLMGRKSALFRSRQLLIWIMSCVTWGIVLVCDPVAVKMTVLVIPMMVERAWNHELGVR